MYAQLLNEGTEFNPNMLVITAKWIVDDFLPAILERDASLHKDLDDLLLSLHTPTEKLLKVVKMLLPHKATASVLRDWIQEIVKPIALESDENLKEMCEKYLDEYESDAKLQQGQQAQQQLHLELEKIVRSALYTEMAGRREELRQSLTNDIINKLVEPVSSNTNRRFSDDPGQEIPIADILLLLSDSGLCKDKILSLIMKAVFGTSGNPAEVIEGTQQKEEEEEERNLSDNSTTRSNFDLIYKIVSFMVQVTRDHPILEVGEDFLDKLDQCLEAGLDPENQEEHLFELFNTFLSLRPHKIFYRILVHSALTHQQLEEELAPIIARATRCKAYTFTVFMDEVNTSSCLGIFKEIMTDGRMNGVLLPPNIYWVAAVNPYRRSSLRPSSIRSRQTMVEGKEIDTKDLVPYDNSNEINQNENVSFRDDYYVRPLPQSMKELVWDFGALSATQGTTFRYNCLIIHLC